MVKIRLDKSDKHFLSYSFLILIIVAGIISYFTPEPKRDIMYYVSLTGSLITVIALLFTMFQQFKLKSITEKLASSKDQMNQAVRNGFYQYSFNKVLWLCDKIEDENPTENPRLVKVFLKELKTILLDCKKANLIHYKRILEEKLEALKKKPDINAEDINDIISCCQDECKAEWEESFKEYILRLAGEYQVLTASIEGKTLEINRGKLNKLMFEIGDYINQIKPDYVSNIDI